MTHSERAAPKPFTTLLSLGLRADAVVADEEPRPPFRVGGDRAADERRDRIVGARQAEEDLVIGIVEGEDRAQRLPRERLHAA